LFKYWTFIVILIIPESGQVCSYLQGHKAFVSHLPV
jgi:hypothetical protein